MMIRSILLYVVPIWKNSAKSYIIKLQRIQSRATRTISRHSRDTRIALLHDDLGFPYLDTIINQLHRNFWKGVQHSNFQHLTANGTTTAQRQLYKMLKQILMHYPTILHSLREQRQLLLWHLIYNKQIDMKLTQMQGMGPRPELNTIKIAQIYSPTNLQWMGNTYFIQA